MKKLDKMTIAELEQYRDQLQAEIEERRAAFKAAGQQIERLRLAEKQEKLKQHIADLEEQAAALEVKNG
jgi:hypothetical protein